jgi:hypothetical protein
MHLGREERVEALYGRKAGLLEKVSGRKPAGSCSSQYQMLAKMVGVVGENMSWRAA